MTAITENNGNATKQLFKENENLKEDLSLSEIMREELNDRHRRKPQCHLSKSVYVPDNAWCLAALYDAREVLQSMREFGVPIWEVNSHANTFLHSIIAWASTDTDELESTFISTIMFVKTLATKNEYRQVLLLENGNLQDRHWNDADAIRVSLHIGHKLDSTVIAGKTWDILSKLRSKSNVRDFSYSDTFL